MYVLTLKERGIKLWYSETTPGGVIVYGMNAGEAKKYRRKLDAENEKRKIDKKDDVCMTVEKV